MTNQELNWTTSVNRDERKFKPLLMSSCEPKEKPSWWRGMAEPSGFSVAGMITTLGVRHQRFRSASVHKVFNGLILGTSDLGAPSSSMGEKERSGSVCQLFSDLRGWTALSVSDHSTELMESFPLITYGTTQGKGVYSMIERNGRKSSNKQVSKPSSPIGTIARPDPELAKALQEVAQSLPKKFVVDDLTIERLVRDYEDARRQKGSGRQEINAIFDRLYGVYVYLNACPHELDRFLDQCGRKGIAVCSDTDLSQILVEFYVRGRSKTATKCAAALCQAALQRIKVGFLALRLGNVGPHGLSSLEGLTRRTCVKAMAEEFADRQKKAEKLRSGGK
jgi:hypothetical protein